MPFGLLTSRARCVAHGRSRTKRQAAYETADRVRKREHAMYKPVLEQVGRVAGSADLIHLYGANLADVTEVLFGAQQARIVDQSNSLMTVACPTARAVPIVAINREGDR